MKGLRPAREQERQQTGVSILLYQGRASLVPNALELRSELMVLAANVTSWADVSLGRLPQPHSGGLVGWAAPPRRDAADSTIFLWVSLTQTSFSSRFLNTITDCSAVPCVCESRMQLSEFFGRGRTETDETGVSRWVKGLPFWSYRPSLKLRAFVLDKVKWGQS